MASYIKVPLATGGIAAMKGTFQRVFSRDDATELEESEAQYLRRKAYEEYPNLDWQVETLSNKKCIIKES